MDTTSFSQKIAPYALKAGTALNMDPAFIMAQWLYETGNGTNLGARKYNNLAGIKNGSVLSAGEYDPADSIHAGYTSLSAFTNDYIRTMSLSSYKDLRSAAAPGSNPLSQYMAVNKSPWSVADYNLSGFMKYYNESAKILGEKNFSLDNIGDLFDTGSDGILKILKEKWWIVAGALVLIAVLK